MTANGGCLSSEYSALQTYGSLYLWCRQEQYGTVLVRFGALNGETTVSGVERLSIARMEQ